MNGKTRAYGIVRSDLCEGPAADYVAAMRRLAEHCDFDLCAIRVEEHDADFGVLLAAMGPSRISVLLVPTVQQLGGWLDAMRMGFETDHRPLVWSACEPSSKGVSLWHERRIIKSDNGFRAKECGELIGTVSEVAV